MKSMRRCLIPAMVLALAALGCATAPHKMAHSRAQDLGVKPTALDKYVHTPDPVYHYDVVNTVKGEGYTGYIIKLTSQQYLTKAEVNHPIWHHWLLVAKPDKVESDKALLYLTGGHIDDPEPQHIDDMFAKFAVATHSIVAVLHGVPNEPLVFADETKERSEDAIIAYTWNKFLHTGDTKWPLRLPMTKSAVRAMDALQDFFKSDEGGHIALNGFVVAGGSKRGWTTWTTAATDDRVIAICPIVIDMLNLVPSFIHHWQVYGFWAPAVKDYTDMGLMKWMGSPEDNALYKLVDPFSYRSRLTMPKMIMNAAGDQFFLPDSSQFYYDALPGEKHLRYVPNSDHGMGGTDAPQTLLAFYNDIVTGTPRPNITWTIEPDGTIRAVSKTKPEVVKLWQATNPKARDFRVESIGKAYTSSVLKDQGNGVYVGKVDPPAKGWTAYFIEFTFPQNGPAPLKLTTQVNVVPNVLPHKYVKPQWPAGGFIRDKQK